MGEFSYALFGNPYHIIRAHHEEGRVNEAKWSALVVRANEIAATDIDQTLDPPLSVDFGARDFSVRR